MSSDNNDQIVLGDFNGDGKTDVLAIGSAGARIYLSTGVGFDNGYPVTNSSGWNAYTVVVGDWNGDGRDDVALISQSGNHLIMLSTGTDFVSGTHITNSNNCNTATPGDWNSDGASDLWLQANTCTNEADTEYTFSYVPELLQQINDGNGKVTTVTYNALNSGLSQNGVALYAKGSGDRYPVQDVDGPIYVVSQIATSDGVGGMHGWDYAYSDLTKNLQGLGYRGFSAIGVTDNRTGVVKTTRYANSFPLYGMPQNVSVTCCVNTSYSVTLSSSNYSWNDNNLGGYYFTGLAEVTTSGSDLNGVSWPSTDTKFNTYDAYGNLKDKTWTNSADGWLTDSASTYNYHAGSWIMDMPQTSTITSTPPQAGQNPPPPLSRSANYNESNNPWQISSAVVEPGNSDTTNLTVSYGYDNWGNTSSTGYSGSDIAARSSGVTYDGFGEFPVTTTNALAQSESWSLAPYFGQTSTNVDLNGHTTTWSTDIFGRPSSTSRPDGTQVTVTPYYCGASPYSCPANAVFLLASTYTGPNQAQNAPTTVVFYDSLGRVIAQDVESFDGSTYSRVNTIYGADGNISQTCRPHWESVGANCTTFTNDPLGRVIQAVLPSGAVNQYGYSALSMTVTLDVGNANETTVTTLNPEGRIATIEDANGGVTSYAYDAFGDPTVVQSPDGSEIQNSFDILGRKLQTNDPDMGTWLFTYDNLGELQTQQSPNETATNLTTLTYDVLGRLMVEAEPDMRSAWGYDTAPYGVGFIASAACSAPQQGQEQTTACASGGYSRTYTYESMASRPASVTVEYSDLSPYTSSETYDNQGTGLLSTLTDFSGNTTTTNHYNAQGYLSLVTDQANANVWAANAMEADGQLTQETEGSGTGALVTERSFDPNTGRLTSVIAGMGGNSSNVVNLAYQWDNLGNLVLRTDTLQGFDESFCYDALNRLTHYALQDGGGSTCTSGTSKHSVEYDQEFANGIGDGNITTKSDVGGYTYGQHSAGPHALTTINTSSTGGCTIGNCKVDGVTNPHFFYDADGNMTCITTKQDCSNTALAARTYSYTYADMPEKLVSGASTNTFGYTPEHDRGELTNAAGALHYFSNPAAGVFDELEPGGAVWGTYLSAGGHIAAEYFTGGTDYFFTQDHIGSTTTLTDENGNEKEYDAYDAWGARRQANGLATAPGCPVIHPSHATLRGYTSQEEMDNLCLVNLNARLYDPALGRMLSPDPTVPGPMNGQAFNRYAYVFNGPLSYTDVSGYTPDGSDDEPLVNCVDGCGSSSTNADVPVVDVYGQRGGPPGGIGYNTPFSPPPLGSGSQDQLGNVPVIVVTGHRPPPTPIEPIIKFSLGLGAFSGLAATQTAGNGQCSPSLVQAMHAAYNAGAKISATGGQATTAGGALLAASTVSVLFDGPTVESGLGEFFGTIGVSVGAAEGAGGTLVQAGSGLILWEQTGNISPLTNVAIPYLMGVVAPLPSMSESSAEDKINNELENLSPSAYATCP